MGGTSPDIALPNEAPFPVGYRRQAGACNVNSISCAVKIQRCKNLLTQNSTNFGSVGCGITSACGPHTGAKLPYRKEKSSMPPDPTKAPFLPDVENLELGDQCHL